MAQGRWDEALDLLEEKRRSKGLDPDEELHLGAIYGLRGEMDRASALLLEVAGRPDRLPAAEALLRLAGLRLSSAASPEEIEPLLERAASLAGEDGRLRGLLAHAWGRLHWKRNQIGEAGARLQEAGRLLEAAGDEEELAKVLDSLAQYHDHRGEWQAALSHYSLSLSKKAVHRDIHGIAITLGNLGRFHLRNGQPAAALSCLRDDLRLAAGMRDGSAQAVIKVNLGQALTALGRLDEARVELEEALELSRRQGSIQQEAYALKDLARVKAQGGDPAGAAALLESALQMPLSSYARGQVLLSRGELRLEGGDLEGARRDFEGARECFSRLKAVGEESSALHGLARVADRRKDWNSCLHYLEEGMDRLSTISLSLVTRFQETFHHLHLGARDRAVPRTIGPYRVLDRIGAGTFGEVYTAFDVRDGASRETVAIKVLRLEGTSHEQRTARFRREREILTAVRHPCVVRLIDWGDDPVPYLVQEFISGGDLSGLIGPGRPLPAEAAVPLLRGILRGLEALHRLGIVHRDLKPSNVLLREDRTPVIADFGIARMVNLTALTLQSAVLGTLGYMAPEQLRGEAVDARADLYALGAIAFEAFSGRLPHPALTLPELVRAMEEGPAPDLRSLRPDLPPALLHVVARCLERDRERRYPLAEEALRDLDAVG